MLLVDDSGLRCLLGKRKRQRVEETSLAGKQSVYAAVGASFLGGKLHSSNVM